MFNGLNMGMIKLYGLNFNDDNPETQGVQGNIDYTVKYEQIKNNIQILSDTTTDDKDNKARDELNTMLIDTFNSGLINTLDNTTKEQLRQSIKSLLDKHKSDENFKEEYKGLIDLAGALGIEWYNDSNSETEVTRPEDLKFVWTLDGISPLAENATPTWELWSWLTREAPGDNENLPKDKNLYQTTENLKKQIQDVKDLLWTNQLRDNPGLQAIKENLENVLNVIKNTTEDNVRILQKFISKNLTDKDKVDFDKASKRGNDFDGKFWQGTLKWTNIILRKTGEYITSMKQYLEALNTKENKEKLDQITIKDNPTIVKVENTEL